MLTGISFLLSKRRVKNSNAARDCIQSQGSVQFRCALLLESARMPPCYNSPNPIARKCRPCPGSRYPSASAIWTAATWLRFMPLSISLMTRLGIEPRQQLGFILEQYGYGFAWFSIGGDERLCPVIFGPDDDYLLGATTLEAFNLLVDPAGEQLLPAEWVSLGWGSPLPPR